MGRRWLTSKGNYILKFSLPISVQNMTLKSIYTVRILHPKQIMLRYNYLFFYILFSRSLQINLLLTVLIHYPLVFSFSSCPQNSTPTYLCNFVLSHVPTLQMPEPYQSSFFSFSKNRVMEIIYFFNYQSPHLVDFFNFQRI